MLRLPQFSGPGIDRRTFRIADSERIDIRRHQRIAQERIVLRERSVGVDSADPPGEVLANGGIGLVAVAAATQIPVVETEAVGAGHVQCSVGCKGQAALRALEDGYDILQPCFILAEPRPRNLLHADMRPAPVGHRKVEDTIVVELIRPERGRLPRRGREVGKIEQPIADKIRIQHHIVQALGRDGLDGWHPFDGRMDTLLGDDPHGAPVLRDQDLAVGQERQRPRRRQAAGDGLHNHPGCGLSQRRIGLARKGR